MATNYTVKPNQSMPDIIIQSLGSMEAGMQFCRDNALSITDTPVAGNTYLVSELAAAAGDLSALQYLDQHDVVIGTLNLMPAPPPPPVVYSRSLTIDHTQCGGSDSVDFPVLLNVTDDTLKLTTHGGHVCNSSGNDIQFFNDEAQTTLLNWEIEKYDGTTGTLVAWVKIPVVSHSVDTTFYIQYGDAGISTFQGGAHGAAWDNDFKLVMHLNGSNKLIDSTSNETNGVLTGTPNDTAGIAAKGLQFNTPPDGIGVNTVMGITGEYRVSISAWFKMPVLPADGQVWPVTVVGNQGGYNCAGIMVHNSFSTIYLKFLIWDADLAYAWAPAANTWYFAEVTYDGTTARLYLDGVMVASSARTIYIGYPQGYIGCFTGTVANYYSPIIIDEVRMGQLQRSDDWILTEYNTVANTTFLTIGSEV